MLFPRMVSFHITGEQSEKNSHHQCIVDNSDSGEGFGNQVEGIQKVEKAQKATQEGAGGPLAIAPGLKVPEHAGVERNNPGTSDGGGPGRSGFTMVASRVETFSRLVS